MWSPWRTVVERTFKDRWTDALEHRGSAPRLDTDPPDAKLPIRSSATPFQKTSALRTVGECYVEGDPLARSATTCAGHGKSIRTRVGCAGSSPARACVAGTSLWRSRSRKPAEGCDHALRIVARSSAPTRSDRSGLPDVGAPGTPTMTAVTAYRRSERSGARRVGPACPAGVHTTASARPPAPPRAAWPRRCGAGA